MNPEALVLARQFIDALMGYAPKDGSCRFCGTTEREMRSGRGRGVARIVYTYEFRGHPVNICSKCKTSLGWSMPKIGLDRYILDMNGATLDDVPEFALAEWAARRVLKMAKQLHAQGTPK